MTPVELPKHFRSGFAELTPVVPVKKQSERMRTYNNKGLGSDGFRLFHVGSGQAN